MKPARFDYIRTETLAEAHAALAADGNDARVIAGGQSLLPMLSMRLARPKVVVDIMHLPGLRKIEDDGNAIRIGAGVRQAELQVWPGLARSQPLLAAALLTRSHVKPIAWSFGLSLASLIASMCIAVATGLASGETEGGWAMALTTLMFVLYILALVVLVVAGIRLAIKLFSAK